MLTIFYDSLCPLCTKEMDALKRFDQDSQLELVDLHSERYRRDFLYVDFDAAMRVLHAEKDGVVITGLDVTAAAWKAVGRQPWVQILRWPVIRWFADRAYILFANNRYRISWLLTGKSRCDQGFCDAGGCDVSNQIRKD